MNSGTRMLCVGLSFAAILESVPAPATDGYFDPTWPGGGTFVFDGDYFDTTASSYVTSMQVEDNGNILLTGYGDPTGGGAFWWLGELFPNGQFAPAFGAADGSGRVNSCKFSPCADVNDVGRIALARPNGSYVILSRDEIWQTTTQAHALDISGVAGGFGYVSTQFEINNAAGYLVAGASKAMALQPDGKLLVGGHAAYSTVQNVPRFGVARLNTNLSLDAGFNAVTDAQNVTFAGGALVTVAATDLSEDVTNILVQPDGKIVLIGSGADSSNEYLEVARLKANGLPDPSFGNNGVAALSWSLGEISVPQAALLDRAGRIVVVALGKTTVFSIYGLLVARLNPDGSPDASFAGGGFAFNADTTLCPDSTNPFAVAIDSAGRIVVAGECENDNFNGGFVVERLRGDTGKIDGSFGISGFSTGYFSPTIPDSDEATAIAFDQGGRLLIAGDGSGSGSGNPVRAGLARLTYDLIYTNNFETAPRGCLPPDCN